MYFRPQSMQTTLNALPCSSISRLLPAFPCRSSTFCVINVWKRGDFSHSARILCETFGSAEEKRGYATKLRDQNRRRQYSLLMNSWCWIGRWGVRANCPTLAER